VKVPAPPPSIDDLLRAMPASRFSEVLTTPIARRHDADQYPHWDKVRFLTPPSGLTREEWWLRLKLERQANRRSLPLLDSAGRPFSLAVTDEALELLHRIDQQAGGQITMAEAVTNPATRDRYVMSSLIEESITSSQLEGAVTSRRQAKELLRSGRAPRDRSEQMITNNFRAMRHISSLTDHPLSDDVIYELHGMLTEGTLDDPTAAGRLQRQDEDRIKVWGDGDQILHIPPPAGELPRRVAAMCRFANGEPEGRWLHPVLRAVVLHFWLAFDHPFEDGNGRTARALFYWAMLRQGYWLTEFLTISSILRKAPAQYARSFLLTETDDNDLTYFVLYQLRVIARAIESLQDYLQRKMAEVRDVEALIRGASLNHRQRALLADALRDAGATYTINSHQLAHAVVYQTARTDLLDLADRGLLLRTKGGSKFVFTVPADLSQRLQGARTTNY
jgi:Fic family protein